MEFCSKCGALIVPKKIKGKDVMACPSCKHIEKGLENEPIVDNVDKAEEVQIVDENQDMEVLPQTDAICSECGHDKARYWVVQTRASDEAPTKFMKCENCSHTWRDYS